MAIVIEERFYCKEYHAYKSSRKFYHANCKTDNGHIINWRGEANALDIVVYENEITESPH